MIFSICFRVTQVGKTTLMYAMNKKVSKAVVALLLNKGSDITATASVPLSSFCCCSNFSRSSDLALHLASPTTGKA
jgi:hypothetical protein